MIKEFGFRLLVIMLSLSFSSGSINGNFEFRKKLNHQKRHALKSIQSEDGDIIDCIDIYKQSAFDHPALRNHKIQMEPSYGSKMEKMNEPCVTVAQLWQKSGACPKGTIPVRRIREKELLKANSVEDFGRKNPSFSHHVAQLNASQKFHLPNTNHSRAIVLTAGHRYTGGKGEIKVWNPVVESDDEYSTSRIALQNGPFYRSETIESGWTVNPTVYGDRQTRLYVYWTVDSSHTTGCFDLLCPGFVQTSHEIALGGAIYPISSSNGLPWIIIIYIFQDPNTHNWWVQYGEKINIGYWPPELFSKLSYMATSVEWGGEVCSSKLWQHPHTATAMGNGNFPDYVFGNSGSIKRMRIRDNDPMLKLPDWANSFSDEYRCYDVRYVGDYVEEPEFYYGGPGRNPMCP